MHLRQIIIKRTFDFLVAFVALMVLSPIIAVCWVIAAAETGGNGFFLHRRVGRHGRIFRVIKITTMTPARSARSAITAVNLASVTKSGRIFRKYKLDELPQLINVLVGHMSLVGPRPDVPGYADLLRGGERAVLALRPGITGIASLKYRNEEELLASVEDPVYYNDNVIWPDKVRLNLEYLTNYSFSSDIQILLRTLRA